MSPASYTITHSATLCSSSLHKKKKHEILNIVTTWVLCSTCEGVHWFLVQECYPADPLGAVGRGVGAA